MEENLGAASWTLTDDEVATLDRVSARPLPYPYWHQQRFNTPRMRYMLSGAYAHGLTLGFRIKDTGEYAAAAAAVAATGLGGVGALPTPDSVRGLIDARRSDSTRMATVP